MASLKTNRWHTVGATKQIRFNLICQKWLEVDHGSDMNVFHTRNMLDVQILCYHDICPCGLAAF